jgi:hypothetical protein
MHMDTGGGNQDAYFHCTLSGTEVLELWQWPSLEAQASPAVQTARVLRVDSKVSIRRDLGSSPVDGEKSLHPQWKKRSSISIGVLQYSSIILYIILYIPQIFHNISQFIEWGVGNWLHFKPARSNRISAKSWGMSVAWCALCAMRCWRS